jgi:TolB protein
MQKILAIIAGRREGRRRKAPAVVARFALVVACMLLSVFLAPGAHAAFPGSNGKIAFMGGQNGNAEIFVMNPDGSGLTNLTNSPANDQDPAWSPDGQKIAFVRDFDIFVMNADGTGQVRLTNNPLFDGQPTWSPDGQKIAFASSRIPGGTFEIFVVNADGTGETNLTNNPADQSPAWSPDGSRIAFTRSTAFGSGVFVMNADGTGQTNLTPGYGSANPFWSPDGRIAFVSLRNASTPDLYIMNPDGSQMEKLADTVGLNEIEGAWSPDGNRIYSMPLDRRVSGFT